MYWIWVNFGNAYLSMAKNTGLVTTITMGLTIIAFTVIYFKLNSFNNAFIVFLIGGAIVTFVMFVNMAIEAGKNVNQAFTKFVNNTNSSYSIVASLNSCKNRFNNEKNKGDINIDEKFYN